MLEKIENDKKAHGKEHNEVKIHQSQEIKLTSPKPAKFFGSVGGLSSHNDSLEVT